MEAAGEERRAEPVPHRALRDIADDILTGGAKYLSAGDRAIVKAMSELERIRDEADRAIVAQTRNAIHRWRTLEARTIKGELETILAHYRASGP
jgi:hypothetical protein